MQRLDNISKIESVTMPLEPSYKKMLENLPAGNADIICNYIMAEVVESNIKDSTREWKIKVLVYLTRFLQHKPFNTVTKEDVLAYLNTLRKPEHTDPMHKWIGTYNKRLSYVNKGICNFCIESLVLLY